VDAVVEKAAHVVDVTKLAADAAKAKVTKPVFLGDTTTTDLKVWRVQVWVH
jgi:hypothetical protein